MVTLAARPMAAGDRFRFVGYYRPILEGIEEAVSPSAKPRVLRAIHGCLSKSGRDAFEGAVPIYVHQELELGDVEKRAPADDYFARRVMSAGLVYASNRGHGEQA